MESNQTPQEAPRQVEDAPTTPAPEGRFGEPPTAPDDEREVQDQAEEAEEEAPTSSGTPPPADDGDTGAG